MFRDPPLLNLMMVFNIMLSLLIILQIMFSCFLWKEKLDVFSTFITFKSFMEKFFQKPIISFCYDNCGFILNISFKIMAFLTFSPFFTQQNIIDTLKRSIAILEKLACHYCFMLVYLNCYGPMPSLRLSIS